MQHNDYSGQKGFSISSKVEIDNTVPQNLWNSRKKRFLRTSAMKTFKYEFNAI